MKKPKAKPRSTPVIKVKRTRKLRNKRTIAIKAQMAAIEKALNRVERLPKRKQRKAMLALDVLYRQWGILSIQLARAEFNGPFMVRP